MNLYQKFGVCEYWIVNPKIKTISVYKLNDNGLYEQFGVYKNNEIFSSAMFEDLNVKLMDVFEWHEI